MPRPRKQQAVPLVPGVAPSKETPISPASSWHGVYQGNPFIQTKPLTLHTHFHPNLTLARDALWISSLSLFINFKYF